MATLATGCSCLTTPKTKVVFKVTKSLVLSPYKKGVEVETTLDVNVGSFVCGGRLR